MTSRTRLTLIAVQMLAVVPLDAGLTQAGSSPNPQRIAVPLIEESAGSYSGFTFVAARPENDPTLAPRSAMSSSIIVTYNGFPPQAQAAVQYAADIWSSVIQSPVPISIAASWRTDLPQNVLGGAGTTTMLRDFPNAPRAGTYYPAALANARAGTDLVAGDEIVAIFNANFDWYVGLDGAARTQFDLVTIALHEIGHGLGIFGSMRLENGVGLWGVGAPPLPLGYDAYMATGNGHSLLDPTTFPNGSGALGQQLISNDVRFDSTLTREVNGNVAPSVFAPTPWMAGSSLSHLSDSLYPNGDPNSLMTPAIGIGEVIHDPGPIARAMLADLGWQIAGLTQPETPKAPRNVRFTSQ
jgi:hypothetical protein